MGRTKLVVWSGGLDSTFLLTKIAEEFSSKKFPVLAYSFVTDFLNSNKVIMENRARKNYLRWAKKRGFHIDYKEVSITFSTIPNKGWAQGLSWFSFIIPFIPNDCDVYFGYIQGDSIWLAVNYFHEAYKNLSYVGDKKNTKLCYPFSYKKKWEIVKEVVDYGIPKKCFWTCEEPEKKKGKIKKCGKCEPCRTLQAAKLEFDLRKEDFNSL